MGDDIVFPVRVIVKGGADKIWSARLQKLAGKSQMPV